MSVQNNNYKIKKEMKCDDGGMMMIMKKMKEEIDDENEFERTMMRKERLWSHWDWYDTSYFSLLEGDFQGNDRILLRLLLLMLILLLLLLLFIRNKSCLKF